MILSLMLLLLVQITLLPAKENQVYLWSTRTILMMLISVRWGVVCLLQVYKLKKVYIYRVECDSIHSPKYIYYPATQA